MLSPKAEHRQCVRYRYAGDAAESCGESYSCGEDSLRLRRGQSVSGGEIATSRTLCPALVKSESWRYPVQRMIRDHLRNESRVVSHPNLFCIHSDVVISNRASCNSIGISFGKFFLGFFFPIYMQCIPLHNTKGQFTEMIASIVTMLRL
jgi:hypothetical protein